MLQSIRQSIAASLPGIAKEEILVERPKNTALCDLYTNAAMVFSKKLNIPMNKLAESICTNLKNNSLISDVNIVHGFVNMKLNNNCLRSLLDIIINKKRSYSCFSPTQPLAVNVEFVSANPTGPLHTGHARNAVFGSVAANLFEKIGYKVTREFYINDQGNQIKYLAQSVYLRYLELFGKAIDESQFTENMYCGDYVKDIAEKIKEQYGEDFLNQKETEWIDLFKQISIQEMLTNIKSDLKKIGVVMDVYTSEAELCKLNLVNQALDILKENGDIYSGILPKPKGTVSDDWEERPQLLFKSTKYGDDVDRAIQKSDGTWTYFAGDLAYHLFKYQRGFNDMLLVLGADHNGYVKRIQAAVKALSQNKAKINVRLYQLVNFLENGKPIRMSKRKGNFITLNDVVNKVGKDVTRFTMVSRHHDVIIDFDLKKAIEFSLDNPVFYIQYAYARICSVFRHYKDVFGEINDNDLINSNKDIINTNVELDLLKLLLIWPEQVKTAAEAIEPHRIPIYLREIAAAFHALWNKGKEDEQLRFVDINNKQKTLARLSLLRAVQIIIKDGLDILGITPIEELRRSL